MEMSPFSDIDLLYLHDGIEEEKLTQVISHINTVLFDSGKEVGHSCRTITECFESLDNPMSYNAFLDSRFLAGSEELYKKYVESFLNHLPGEVVGFHNENKIQILEERIFKGNQPILLSEPNIKNDPCGLRDIQTIYWLEKSEKKIPSLSGLGVIPVFTRGEVERLESAYDFFLRVRNALHVMAKRKIDRLELTYQPEIAEYLGFGPKSEIGSFENLMKVFYKHQKEVNFFIGLYLDYRKTSKSGVRYTKSIFEEAKIFHDETYAYPSEYGQEFMNPDTLYRDIMLTFLACQSLDVEPSRLLLNEIKFASNFLEEDFKMSKSSIEIFLRILKNKKKSGKILTSMHECEILGKLLPEFGACTYFALFSYHHQYTVDEHSLFILRELDKLIDGIFEDEKIQNEFFLCRDIHILILSILIHDAGKVKEGDHCQYGAELATAIGERLGLSVKEIGLFRFLVKHHIDMSELSTKRDISDPKLIENFAKIVGDSARLRLLYILTIIDTKSVGHGVLTNWKKEILSVLFQKTLEYLGESQDALGEIARGSSELELLMEFLSSKERLPDSSVQAIAGFAAQVLPATYLSYNTHRRIYRHFLNVDALKKLKAIPPVVEAEPEPAFFTVTIYSEDYRYLLSDITGTISSEGLNLIGMRSFKSSEGYAINIIQFTDSLGSGNISEEKIDRLKNKIKVVIQKQKNVEEFISSPSEWISFNKIPKGMVQDRIEFDNHSSEDYTILEVRLPDSLGLLYRLLKSILTFDVQLHFVIVSTSADFAFDSFYLKSPEGNKIEDPLLLKNMVEEIKNSAFGRFSEYPKSVTI